MTSANIKTHPLVADLLQLVDGVNHVLDLLQVVQEVARLLHALRVLELADVH